MKTVIKLCVLGLLVVAIPGVCLALRSIGIVTKEQAKEMGIEVRAVGSDPEQVWIELEFKPEGKLKDYRHVEMDINEGDKMLLGYTVLKDVRQDSGKVLVRVLTTRTFLEKITLEIVVDAPTPIGHMIRLKDF